LKVEFIENNLIQSISELIQTPPAQNSPSVMTRVIRRSPGSPAGFVIFVISPGHPLNPVIMGIHYGGRRNVYLDEAPGLTR